MAQTEKGAVAAPEKPFLALCMIVRDASATIDTLLESVKGEFDEYVFVDTGSVDDTREKIIRAFDLDYVTWPAPASAPFVHTPYVSSIVSEPASPLDDRIVLASFNWVDDFAAARNYAFGLATARWRAFLDADDELVSSEPRALYNHILGAEKRDPRINAISIPYAYAKDDTQQDTVRVVRWDDGFFWRDEIHEHLVRRAGPRCISIVADFISVTHHKSPEDMMRAFERNRAIAWPVYQRTTDPDKKARFAYHLAQEAKFAGEFDEALAHLDECIEAYGETNTGAYAYSDIIRIHIQTGDLGAALRVAGEMTARLPEFREGHMLVAVVNALMKKHDRAALVFDEALKKEPLAMQSLEDVWFTRGYCPALAAQSYVRVGRYGDAERLLGGISESMSQHAMVRDLVIETTAEVMKHRGLTAVQAIVDYLCQDTEAPKALRFLEECVPAAVGNHPVIAAKKRDLKAMLRHLNSWKDYKEAYASIPAETYHTANHDREGSLSLERARQAVALAEALPKDGDPIHLASIGFQDGIIESAVLDANPRIRLTALDVAPQANEGLRELQARFGERVAGRPIIHNHYDWGSPRDYDLIFMFEVLEHLPSDGEALRRLHMMLRPEGEILISTPVASRWVEPYLTDPKTRPEWYGHVRAHNHVSLWELFLTHGFDGTLYEGYDGTFVAHMHHSKRTPWPRRSVGIVVPTTPKPFGPFSHEEGFVGGSEECVIHLAAALAARDFEVTVYAPVPEGYPIVRGHEGVAWRGVDEFDLQGDAHEAVFFWRYPTIVPEKAPYKKLLWLHDAYYDVPNEVYQRADEVLYLSESHRESLMAHDGWDGKNGRKVANGIDRKAFLEGGGNRNPKRVIYASSPDRGLSRLLDVWPTVREQVPDAELHIYYDWSNFFAKHPYEAQVLMARVKALVSQGVEFYGGVDHATLHAAFREGGVLAYPTSGVVETFCITVVKALAAGMIPVTTDAGALVEVRGKGGAYCPGVSGEDIDTEEGKNRFTSALVKAMLTPDPVMRFAGRDEALERFAWDRAVELFIEALDADDTDKE